YPYGCCRLNRSVSSSGVRWPADDCCKSNGGRSRRLPAPRLPTTNLALSAVGLGQNCPGETSPLLALLSPWPGRRPSGSTSPVSLPPGGLEYPEHPIADRADRKHRR